MMIFDFRRKFILTFGTYSGSGSVSSKPGFGSEDDVFGIAFIFAIQINLLAMNHLPKLIFLLLFATTLYSSAQVESDKKIQLTGSGSDAKIEGIQVIEYDHDAVNRIYVDTAIVNRTGGANGVMHFTIGLNKVVDTLVLSTSAVSKTYQVTVTRTSGNQKPLFLKVTGVPAGVSYSLQPGGFPTFTTDLVLTVNSYTALNCINCNHTITVTAYDGDSSESVNLSLHIRGALVFLTKNLYNGALGGVAGADNICNARAAAAGLTGEFVAMVSLPTSHFKDRLTTDRLWVNMQGTVVAAGRTALFGGPISTNTVYYFEDGAEIEWPWNAWTNTNQSGNSNSSNHCTNWTSSSSGVSGQVGSCCGGQNFYNNGNLTCNTTARLYCFEK